MCLISFDFSPLISVWEKSAWDTKAVLWRAAVNQHPKSCVRDSRALLQFPCFCVTNRQYAVLKFSSNEFAIQCQHQGERLSSLPLQLLSCFVPLPYGPASPGKDWALSRAPEEFPVHLSELNNFLLWNRKPNILSFLLYWSLLNNGVFLT